MRARSFWLGTSGILLLLAAVAHFFGWAQFRGSLDAVDAPIVAALRVGWTWGSAGLAALGVIVLAAASGWRRHGRDPRPAAVPAAMVLILFGLWAWVSRDFNPHFLAFVVLGVLVGAPLIGGRDFG